MCYVTCYVTIQIHCYVIFLYIFNSFFLLLILHVVDVYF